MQLIFSVLFGRWQQLCGLSLLILQQLVNHLLASNFMITDLTFYVSLGTKLVI